MRLVLDSSVAFKSLLCSVETLGKPFIHAGFLL